MTGRAGKAGALLQAFGAGDVQPALDAIDDNVVWRLPSLGLHAEGRAAVAEQLQQAAGQVSISLYRFRTRHRGCDLWFGQTGRLRQDHGSWLFVCSTCS
jgi:hypothetical protein